MRTSSQLTQAGEAEACSSLQEKRKKGDYSSSGRLRREGNLLKDEGRECLSDSVIVKEMRGERLEQ